MVEISTKMIDAAQLREERALWGWCPQLTFSVIFICL